MRGLQLELTVVPEYVDQTNGRSKDTAIILTWYKASSSNQAGAHQRGCEIWGCSDLKKPTSYYSLELSNGWWDIMKTDS